MENPKANPRRVEKASRLGSVNINAMENGNRYVWNFRATTAKWTTAGLLTYAPFHDPTILHVRANIRHSEYDTAMNSTTEVPSPQYSLDHFDPISSESGRFFLGICAGATRPPLSSAIISKKGDVCVFWHFITFRRGSPVGFSLLKTLAAGFKRNDSLWMWFSSLSWLQPP